MLDIFGVDYIHQHVRQAYKQKQENKAYRLYLAETMRCISESVAKFSGGPYVKEKWADIINPKPKKERKPGETAAEIIKGAGLVVVRKRR